ncbi:hypothetical protein EOPP23_00100 [Endozoicomonas sp. OPT23]|uniref:hypothetical protein n=1 Tax=Endozoicomonas sp. OPT23 TaxID=2072845 RepID=UPI00129B1E38|nr:hypothetical protein [Endozoicomonas sp. OPT23]MRI31389.1 hypothetical protein [Endozoicomonas sp. OPT23]
MKFVNRCVVSLKPKQPFIDWATGLGTELPEDWSLEGGAYFLDEQETEEGIHQIVAHHAVDMFENELSAWEEDHGRWPEKRDIDALKEWFDLHISVAGFDIGEESLMTADLADLEVM